MPSSTSSSDQPASDAPGASGTHGHATSAERPTAADRPGVAQPVPVRPVPAQPWGRIGLVALLLFLALLTAWEWRMRTLELAAGDIDDSASAWAEQRRRIDGGNIAIAIIGDSRILFDTDLGRFEAMTGVRPVQLALPGTNARPFLEDLAVDTDFRGLVIVGITDVSYFRDEIGLMADALDSYRNASPSQRSGHLLGRAVERRLAFVDQAYRFSTLVHRLDPGWRANAGSPRDDVWKVSTSSDDRQKWLWTRLEHDTRLRDHAREVWLPGKRDKQRGPATPEVIARAQSITRKAVASIRARGGDVVFVRPPSSPELRIHEDRRITRSAGWDPLLAAAAVRGIHFEDYAAMQGLDLPEWSHLSRRCATVFTDAYVRELARATRRLTLRADAPLPLRAQDCLGRGAEPPQAIPPIELEQ